MSDGLTVTVRSNELRLSGYKSNQISSPTPKELNCNHTRLALACKRPTVQPAEWTGPLVWKRVAPLFCSVLYHHPPKKATSDKWFLSITPAISKRSRPVAWVSATLASKDLIYQIYFRLRLDLVTRKIQSERIKHSAECHISPSVNHSGCLLSTTTNTVELLIRLQAEVQNLLFGSLLDLVSKVGCKNCY